MRNKHCGAALLFATALVSADLRALSSQGQASEATPGQLTGEAGAIELEAGHEGLRRQFREAKEVHRFALRLRAGEFVHLVVDQLGLDVEVSVLSPDGERLIQMDTPTLGQGSEEVSCVAAVSGVYHVEVRALEESDLKGAYEISLRERRPATPADRRRVEAERGLVEGYRLVEAQDADSRRKAVGRLEAVLPIWRELGPRRFEAMAMYLLARGHSRLGEPKVAVELYTKALSLSRATGDRLGESFVLFGRGFDLYRLQDFGAALADYEEALRLSQAVGDRGTEAEILTNIGDVYSGLGDKERARETYVLALPLMRSTKSRLGELRVINDIGVIHDFLGAKQQALESYSEALALARKIGSRESEGSVLLNLGRLYGGVGEVEKGRDLLHQSEAIVRSLGDRRGEALAFRYLGESYADERDYERATEAYNQALPLFRLVADGRNEGRVLNALGEVLVARGDPGRAEPLLEQALSLAEKAGNRFLESVARTNLGVVYARRGEADRALDQLHRALALRLELGDRPGQAETRFEIARVQRDRGELEAARIETQALVALAESLRVEVAAPDLRASFFSRLRRYYGLAIDVAMRMHAREPGKGLDSSALEIAERAQARSLLDLLNESRGRIREGADPALLERQSSLASLLAGKIERRVRLLTTNPNSAPAAAVAVEIEELNAQLGGVGRRLRETSPRYANLVDPQTLTSSSIQSDLLDGETALLEFFLGEERSFLWVVTKKAVATYELPPRHQVEDAARRVYELLTARNLRPKAEAAETRKHRVDRADADYRVAAGSLSRMLLGLGAADLAGKRLLIVADGALHYVPFAALKDPAVSDAGFEPLTLRHEIVTLPSASVLSVLRKETAGRPMAARTLAVLADPVFDRNDERVAPRADSGPQRSPTSEGSEARVARLPFTRREARAILDQVPERSRKEALDFDASRATATSPELGGYRFIHFATHGFLDSLHPELSGLVLSLVDRKGRDQPGFLGAADIFNLRLPAELVVLSGCQTALGKEIKGEGLVGLTRAFMYAGAPRVVASLWKVDDVATAELMKRFYAGMLGPRNLHAAAALREAQVQMERQKRWRDPYYWAAFVLQGEWN